MAEYKSVHCSFLMCDNIKNVYIPASVTDIEHKAFPAFDPISSVTVSPRNRCYRVESGCLIDVRADTVVRGFCNAVIPDGVAEIGEYAFEMSGITKIDIPRGVTKIGECAFAACEAMTEARIPETVTEIGKNAFTYCTGLKSFDVDGNNPIYVGEKGCLYDKTEMRLLRGATAGRARMRP